MHAYEGHFEEAIPLMQRALAIREAMLGPQHPDAQSLRQSLAAMVEDAQRAQRATPRTREEQIAEITGQAEGGADARAALAEQLEQLAQQAEAGEDASSPDTTRLREQSGSSAPSGTDAPDGSAG